MPRRSALVFMFLPLAVALVGCGDDAGTATPETATGRTLYVKASGMVQKLGIT